MKAPWGAALPDEAAGRLAARRAAEAVRSRFGEAVLEQVSFRGEETLRVDPERLVEICRFLKDDDTHAFAMLVDVTASHWLDRDHRYEVAYLLGSLRNNALLRLKVRLGEDGRVPTVTGVWAGADWLEREEWDKVGVVFEGHPNLKRILLPDDWEGHPLRKDYPMEGIGA